MTTQEPEANPETVLQQRADAARERLFETIHRLDHRAKTWAQNAAETTRVSGLGLAGAFVLWAGIAFITRRRERPTGTALMLRARPPSMLTRVGIVSVRIAAAWLGYVVTHNWALRLLADHHARQTRLPSGLPQVRQLGGASALTAPASVQPSASAALADGTPNA